MAETKVEMPPVANDEIKEDASKDMTTNSATSQQEENGTSVIEAPNAQMKDATVNGESQAPGAAPLEKGEQSDKPVSIPTPVSAHQRERKEHDSSRVKEARRYNNDRGRPRHNKFEHYTPRKPYQNHNKFDPASLPESADPVAIRKQVRRFRYIDSYLFANLQRLNSTFQIQISSWTSSFSQRPKDTRTFLYP